MPTTVVDSLGQGAVERKCRVEEACSTPGRRLLLEDDIRGESSGLAFPTADPHSEVGDLRHLQQAEIDTLLKERGRCQVCPSSATFAASSFHATVPPLSPLPPAARQIELQKLKDMIGFSDFGDDDYRKRQVGGGHARGMRALHLPIIIINDHNIKQ